jgi:cation-transporting ATPase F
MSGDFDAESPHALAAGVVIDALGTDASAGLEHDEVARRLDRIGPNVLPGEKPRPLWRLVIDQFRSPLIYVLLAAAVATIAIGHPVDSLVIAAVLVVNAGVGVIQEARAGAALAALASLAGGSAQATREGCSAHVPAADLVPGDLVVLEAGDRVPADLRLIECHELRIDEASLTGESVPVSKSTHAVASRTPLADRACMAFTGSLVTSGRARGIVVATGPRTQVGSIHALMASTQGVATPLTRQLASFSRLVTLVILILAALTFAVGILRGETVAYMTTGAVALAVGAIPEGLPAVVTITLAIGVSRMARRKAVIRHLPAVETLGSVTVICTDKTGTLTENRMTVQSVYCDGQWWPIGPGPVTADVRDCLLAGVLCNDARVGSGDEHAGDPMEVALLVAAQRAAPEVLRQAECMERIDEVPFTSATRRMAVLHAVPASGEALVSVKGAAEEVLALCGIGEAEASRVTQACADAGDEALRVIALASATVPASFSLDGDSLRRVRLRFLGLQALLDPPRPAASAAVHACHDAGIDVLMVTGDHERTARAVAKAVGVPAAGVFARVTAEDKLTIVHALQDEGHVVAMTGDGVNDAPALKQADIGVAMGESGTEVAKESADMVILDDDFATIEAAVEEGRTVYDNLVKFIVWTLPTNFAEGLIVLLAIGLNTALPILPLQILWINTVTAVALGVMLAFEPAEPDIMRRPPRPPRRALLSRALAIRVAIMGAAMLLGTFGAFVAAMRLGLDQGTARTVAVNCLVIMEIAYLLACRSLRGSLRSVGVMSNPWIWTGIGVTLALQLVLTYVPTMNSVFGTAPLDGCGWLIAGIPGPLIYAVASLLKRMPST